MSKQKNAVKRGGKAHNGYLAKMNAEASNREYEVWHQGRVYSQDMTIIALRKLGFGPKRMRDFFNAYNEVETQLTGSLVEENREEILHKEKIGCAWVTRETIENLVKEAVPAELFVPFQDRYIQVPERYWTVKDQLIKRQQDAMNTITEEYCKHTAKLEAEISMLKGQIKVMKVKEALPGDRQDELG